jgi:hypothetical protein
MGTNGFQEPATDFKDGKIIGTKRLFADGKFKSKDGKATFMETKWRGLQAPGKEAAHQHRVAERLSGSGQRVCHGSIPVRLH